MKTGIAKKIREKIKELPTSETESNADTEVQSYNTWPGIPNEPITLDQFMAKFCRLEKGTYIVGRRKALLAAVRNGSVKLPMYVKTMEKRSDQENIPYMICSMPGRVTLERSLVTPLLPKYQKD